MKRDSGTSVCTLALFLVGFASLQTGCAARQTRKNHNDLLGELTRLQYEQVLDNVAMFRSGRGKVPHFAVLNNSTTQINHSNGYTNGFNWSPFTLTGATLGTSGSRANNEQFAGVPVTDANRLQRMSSALEMAIHGYGVDVRPKYVADDKGDLTRVVNETGNIQYLNIGGNGKSTHREEFEVATSDECVNHVRELVSVGVLPAPPPELEVTRGSFEFRSHDDASDYQMTLLNALTCRVPTCWFGFGEACDVPGNALYVGRFQNCRAWVTCTQVDALSRFTLTMLELSTADPPSPTVEIRRLLTTPKGEIELTGDVAAPITDYITVDEIEALIEADEQASVDELDKRLSVLKDPDLREQAKRSIEAMEKAMKRTQTKLRKSPPLKAAPSRRSSRILNIAPQGLIVTPSSLP